MGWTVKKSKKRKIHFMLVFIFALNYHTKIVYNLIKYSLLLHRILP